MLKFEIRWGMAGGFGGAGEWEKFSAKDLEAAETEAWERACELYNSYDGAHGLRTVEEIMEDEGLNETDAEDAWSENREGWVEYEAREVK